MAALNVESTSILNLWNDRILNLDKNPSTITSLIIQWKCIVIIYSINITYVTVIYFYLKTLMMTIDFILY